MTVRLHKIVGPEFASRIETVGIICAGPCLKKVRCWSPGVDSLIYCHEEEEVYQFPENYDDVDTDLWPLVMEICQIVINTAAVVARARSRRSKSIVLLTYVLVRA